MKTNVSVKDFGPIEQATVSLRPLTVFVGPSNTGKTYLATLLYALHRIFCGFLQLPIANLPTNNPIFNPFGTHRFMKMKFSDEDIEFMSSLINEQQVISYLDLPQCVHQFISKPIENGRLAATLESELSRLFDIDSQSELVNAHGEVETASIAVSAYNNVQKPSGQVDELPLWQVESTIGGLEPATHFSPPNGLITISESSNPKRSEDYQQSLNQRPGVRADFLFGELLRRILPDLGWRNATFLPAARSGFMQSHLVISSAIVGMATRGGIQSLPEIPILPGAIADFLSNLLLLSDRQARRGIRRARRRVHQSHEIVKHIEQTVLQGDVKFQNDTGSTNPKIIYSPHNLSMDLPLNRASAMVSELAPLVLYLRDMVHPGDLLVIEEPEAHLHPAAQTHMASTIARIVRMGVDVVVTTHSDWLIQALGNLVRLGELTAKGDAGVSTEGADDWLLAEEIGVWEFKPDADRGSTVEEIEFDWDQGLDPPEYQYVVEQLYNDTTMLYNKHQSMSNGVPVDVA